MLADTVGPRRPTSRSERIAAIVLRERLRERGLDAADQRFPAYASFGLPFGAITAAAIAPTLLPARSRRLRSGLALLAGAALLSEGSLRRTPLSRLLARGRSQNVVATIEPSKSPQRTACVLAHIDSSRSGLIFDPRFVGWLGRWIAANSLLTAGLVVAEPVLGGTHGGRLALGLTRAVLAAGLGLLLERELRGVDVQGANDNASGVAVAAALACEAAADPLDSTRLVLLLSGSEEAGTLGVRAFLDAHDTEGWLFVNFDNVGSGGTLRFLRREGVLKRWSADPGLIVVAEELAARRPELRIAPEDSPAGLTYDSSPVLAGGGRGLTFSIQDGSIPNLHQPSDTVANLEPDGIARALEAAREMLAAIDRGAAG